MRRTAIDASRKPQVIKEVSVGAGVTDFPDRVHIAFKRNDLPDAEFLSDKDFIIAFFELLIQLHNSTECHKLECFPRGREAVIRILLMVALNDRIALEVGGVNFIFKIPRIRTADNRRTYKPYGIGRVFVGKVVNQCSSESNLNSRQVSSKQQTQVKIEVIEFNRVLKSCAVDIFVCAVSQLGI